VWGQFILDLIRCQDRLVWMTIDQCILAGNEISETVKFLAAG